MACVGLVPVTLECPVCSFPVEVSMCFWADFLLSIILRWLSPPPRVWSLATSFSCSASPNLACLEPGVSPGVCVCVCVCACAPMCMQAWSLTQDPPCLAAESGTRIVPLLGPARPLSDCPYLLCFWAAFPPPTDVGLSPSASFPDGGEHWIRGNVLLTFAVTCVC